MFGVVEPGEPASTTLQLYSFGFAVGVIVIGGSVLTRQTTEFGRIPSESVAVAMTVCGRLVTVPLGPVIVTTGMSVLPPELVTVTIFVTGSLVSGVADA